MPIALSLVCFFFYSTFLIRYGEMFFWGSDLVANAAYGRTLFSEVHRAGWTVPKPAHMLIFGFAYWISRDLVSIHLILVLATALTVWAGCRLILRHDEGPIGCVAFSIFMMTLPHMFSTTLSGGPGCLNVMFLVLAVLYVDRLDRKHSRALLTVFLSLANLTRPDSWPCTYLILFLILGPRLFDRTGPGLSRSDLWYLVPVGMPLLWIFLDWTIFGDPLYSMKIVKAFGEEAIASKYPRAAVERNELAAFLPRVKAAFFDLFSVPGWVSVRGVLFVTLFVAGVGRMVRRHPRGFLLVACLLLGTLIFYFVYALRGVLFRVAYIHTALVCVTLLASSGLAGLCGLARTVTARGVGRWIQWGLACAALLYLTVGPFRGQIVKETIPEMKQRAQVSKRARPAIESLVADVKRTGGTPIILATGWMPPSRIALELGTGKDLYLVERLVLKKRLGEKDLLPDFHGRTVYFCVRDALPKEVWGFLDPLVKASNRREVIYRGKGLTVLKCFYEDPEEEAG